MIRKVIALLAALALATPAYAQNFQGFLPTDTLMGRDTAGTGQVEIITLGSGLTMSGSGALQVTGAGIAVLDPFTVRSTDAGAGTDPNIIADRDSASPAAADNLGEFDFQGNDSTLVDTTYAFMRGELVNATDTTEAAEIRWAVMTAGTLAEELTLDGAALKPTANDGLALGTTALQFSDVFCAEGCVINFDNGDLTLTQTGDVLAIAGSTNFQPSVNDGSALGAAGTAWSDVFLAEGGIFNWDSGDVTITQTGNTLAFAGADSGYTFSIGTTIGDAIVMSSTDAGNATGPTLLIDRDSATPAAGDNLGGVTIRGNDAGLLNTDYAEIRAELVDPTDLSEDSELRLAVMTAGTLAEEIRLDGATLEPFANFGLALGDDTNRWLTLTLADSDDSGTPGAVNFGSDVTISNSASNTLSITGTSTVNLTDGGGDTINLSDNTTISWFGGDSTLFNDGTADTFMWAGVGTLTLREDFLTADNPTLTLDNDAVAAAGLNLGRINFSGNDSAAGNPVYTYLRGEIVDHTDGSEDGELRVAVIVAGSADEEFIFENNSFSPNASADANLGTSARPWGKLTLVTNTANTIDFDSGAGGQTISHQSAGDVLTFSSPAGEWVFSTTDDTANSVLTMDRDDATPTANDEIFSLSWRGNDSGGVNQVYGGINVQIEDTTATSEDASIRFYPVGAGAQVEEYKMNVDNFGPVSNDGAALGISGTAWSDAFFAAGGIIDFDAGDNTITDGTNQLIFAGADAASGYLFRSTDAGATATGSIVIDRDSASPAANDILNSLIFQGNDSTPTDQEYARLQATAVNVTAGGSEVGRLETFTTKSNVATLTERLEGHNAFLYKDDGANPGTIAAIHWCKLTSDNTLTSVGTIQALLDGGGCPANGRVTVDTGQYEFQCHIGITAMSATSGNAAFTLGGTATYANIVQSWVGQDGASAAAAALSGSWSQTSASPASAVTAGTATAMNVDWFAAFDITAAGTILPQITLVTAAAAVVEQGSWCTLYRMGDTATATVGAWD